jgi:hypothetical protein
MSLVGEPQAGQDLFDLPVVVLFRWHQALHSLGQHGGFGELDMLLHVADAIPFGHGDGAVVSAFLADDDAKQGGFAVSVAADQSHPFLGELILKLTPSKSTRPPKLLCKFSMLIILYLGRLCKKLDICVMRHPLSLRSIPDAPRSPGFASLDLDLFSKPSEV